MHKLVILDGDTAALDRLVSSGAILRRIDYGSFQLLFVTDQAMALLEETALERVRVRDDYDLIALNGWTVDTRVGEPADLPPDRKQSPGQFAWQLYVVQFAGPMRDEWMTELTAPGDVQIIGYLPNNAYFARATPAAWARLDTEASRGTGALQWAGVYHPAYRVAQSLDPAIADGTPEIDVVVQLVDSPEGRTSAERIRRDAVAALDDVPPLGGLRNVRVRVPASSVLALAREAEVTWIEPWLSPQPSDERVAQIVANNVTVVNDEEQPSGVGYWQWLEGKSLTCPVGANQCTNGYFSGFSVDVSDLGFDMGSTTDVISPDFTTSAGLSRIVYVRSYVGGSPSDVRGHGTLSAATIAGYNITVDDESRDDESLYQYGLGIAPAARLGASKMIGSSAFSTIISDAYASGARISNNSWNGANLDNTYDTTAQTYDMLVRDAIDYGNGGNQEMTIVFAASNNGPGAHSVTRPGPAKNIITVGASENFRKTLEPGTANNACAPSSDADDAQDIVSFSARGPTHDGRVKPDIVAPGTRITGAGSRTTCDAGPIPPPSCDNVEPDVQCNVPVPPCCPQCLIGCGFIRDDLETSRKYIVADGTSFAAPAVSGAAALVRQYFRTRTPAWTPDPSPAMTKAFLLASATYLTGDGAAGALPSNSQGYGRLNLGRAFDGAANRRVDQTVRFRDTGETPFTMSGTVANSSKPFRVVLAWTDAYGMTSGNAYNNNLDLEVTLVNEPEALYRGNLFGSQYSRCVDSVPGMPVPSCVVKFAPTNADSVNNTEAVFLPAGTTGVYTITVRATGIGWNGVPGDLNGDSSDQDFALFVYNGAP